MLIEQSLVKTLSLKKLGLEDWFLLNCIRLKENWYKEFKLDSSERIRKLVRRGYLDENMKITEAGINLLDNNIEIEETTKKTQLLGVSNFEEFWNSFPKSDAYAHHKQTRVLRIDRARTVLYYNRIIAENTITHDQLLNCLKLDIQMRQKASLSGQNEFKYMPSAPAWLNKKYYEPYLNENIDNTTESQLRYGEEVI